MKNLRSPTCALALGFAVCMAFTPEAAAQNQAYPLRVAQRPITLPERTLRIDAGFNAAYVDACVTVLGRTSCSGATATALNVGAGFGITPDLEVGALVLPLQLTSEFAFGNPSVYARYRFVRTDQIQVGADLRLVVPARSGSSFGVQLGVPVAFYVNETFQVQTGLYYSSSFSDPLVHGLSVPAAFNLNLSDNLHLGLRTGIELPFRNPGEGLTLPLGLEVGYTLAQAGNRPLVDIAPYFNFPAFLTPGSSGDVVQSSLWTTGVNARVFLFL